MTITTPSGHALIHDGIMKKYVISLRDIMESPFGKFFSPGVYPYCPDAAMQTTFPWFTEDHKVVYYEFDPNLKTMNLYISHPDYVMFSEHTLRLPC